MDFYEAKENELYQRQEEILLRREALLRGREAYYDAQDNRPSSFIADYSKAMQRNEQLLSDINTLTNKLRVETGDNGKYRDFKTLKDNYWVMVRNTFPVWHEEQLQYEHKHGASPRSSAYQPSPRLSGRSAAGSVHSSFPVPRSPKSSRASPRMSGVIQRSPQASPRPGSSHFMRQSHETMESTQETLTVPPLELDFSQGDDLTTMSQMSASKRPTTPKSALASSTSTKSKNKKVQIKEEKKAAREQKKADERAASDRRKAEQRAAKEEKERQKQLAKQAKKDSARSEKSSKGRQK